MEGEDRTLVMLLRASRYVGGAPYRSLRASQISRPFTLYSRLMFFFCSGAIVAALLQDARCRINGLNSIDSVSLWVLQSFVIVCFTGILYFGMFHSGRRMQQTFYYWKLAKKIRKSVGQLPASDPGPWRLGLVLVVMEITIVILNVLDIKLLLELCSTHLKTMITITVISFGYFVINIITTHFVVMALMINSSFQAINEHLVEVVSDVRSNDESLDPRSLKIPITEINHKIDMLGTFVGDSDKLFVHERLRLLARAYVSTCGLVRQHNHCEEVLLLLLLTYIVLNLVTALWYIVSALMMAGVGSLLLPIALNSVWYFLHVCRGMVLTAPYHAMNQEVRQTRNVICKLLCGMRADSDPLLPELDVFMFHLVANQPTYTVLGIYTMKRSLVLATMAFATSCQAIFQ